jgi:hypothetical protein
MYHEGFSAIFRFAWTSTCSSFPRLLFNSLKGKEGSLRYQDISTGNLVADINTKLGPSALMRQNPRNAILHVGHQNGMSMEGVWSVERGVWSMQ